MPVPEDNLLTAEKIAQGRRLFNDRSLSRDGSISCVFCHDQRRRNAPAIINRGYGRSFFRDGRVATLEEQVLKPIQDPNGMDLTFPKPPPA